MSAPKKRRAIVDETHAFTRVTEVERYLPANYRAKLDDDHRIVIEGHDDAGWTLDGYVIPRLASGLIAAHEVETEPDLRHVLISYDGEIDEGLRFVLEKLDGVKGVVDVELDELTGLSREEVEVLT